MDVVIYARLGLRELNRQVLEQRVATCRIWSEHNGFQVIGVFTDWSCSGDRLDRKGFTQLCEFVIKKRLPIVITQLSQLTTSVRDAALIADVFDELGVKVYSVAEGLISVPELATLRQEGMECKRAYLRHRLKTPRSGMTERQLISR